MHENQTQAIVLFKRNTTYKHYAGTRQVYFLNLLKVYIGSYGDSSLPRPKIFVTNWPYLRPDDAQVSIAEDSMLVSARTSRGDLSTAEAGTALNKMTTFRSNLVFEEIDFQSIFLGSQLANTLIFCGACLGTSITMNSITLDMDGRLFDGADAVQMEVRNTVFNLTNMNSGLWLEPRQACTSITNDFKGKLYFENNYIFGIQQQAVNHFVFASLLDDIYIRNNTFEDCSWTNLDTRPMFRITPSTYCTTLTTKSQEVVIGNNHFTNLDSSNIIFSVIYTTAYAGTKSFTFVDNMFLNSRSKIINLKFVVNSQLVDYQINQNNSISVLRNSLQNATIDNGKRIVRVIASQAPVTIQNITIDKSQLDDLFTIQSANQIEIDQIKITEMSNTGSITQESSIIRILQASTSANIQGLTVHNSTFSYGKIVEATEVKHLEFTQNNFTDLIISNQDLIVLTRVQNFTIEGLTFNFIKKASSSSKAAILINSLLFTASFSKFQLQGITFSQSECSFFSLLGMELGTNAQSQTFSLIMNDIMIDQNKLSGKDSLITLGSIAFQNFTIQMKDLQMKDSELSLGSFVEVYANCKDIVIQDSTLINSTGRFLTLTPSSADTNNPLLFRIEDTTFTQNSGGEEALMLVSTNSKLSVKKSTFLENYSCGRGSIIFADFEKAEAKFQNCSFTRNYAYHGGIFYSTYQSIVEIASSTITENFAVVGAVGYVNNDGIAKISSNTKLMKNQGLNTCLIFIINSREVSTLQDLEISQNDQQNSIIEKTLFLSLSEDYKHIKKAYFDYLKTVETKVARTVNENSDFALQAISGKLMMQNISIQENAQVLSASTNSQILISNVSITNTTSDNKLIQSVLSFIEMSSVRIQNIKHSESSTGDFLFSVEGTSQLRLSNVTLEQIQNQVFYLTESSITAQDLHMRNIENENLNYGIIMADTSIVNLKNVEIDNVKQQHAIDIMYLDECNAVVDGMTVTNFDKTLIHSVYSTIKASNMEVTQFLNMPNSTLSFSSLVFSMENSNLEIKTSQFYDLYTYQSSSVISISKDHTDATRRSLLIEDSIFTNNTANVSGGVFTSSDVDVTVNRSSFTSNVAKTQNGGVMQLLCSLESVLPCAFKIENSQFTNNSAKIDGGAIKFDFYEPDTSVNCTFVENKAKYGQDIAAYPAGVQVIIEDDRHGRILQEVAPISGMFKMIVPQVSGSIMSPSIQLRLLDPKGNPIQTDNSSTAELISVQANRVDILKSKSVIAVDGVFTFDDALIIAVPGDTVQIRVSVDSIIKDKVSKAFPDFESADLVIEIFMRECIRGEYQTPDNKCTVCSEGFFTLLDKQTSCKECPENAICQEGYKIIPNDGYWRTDVNSSTIYECFNPDSCLSEYEVTCAVGYGGNLCQSCVKYEDTWYSKTESKVCSKCPEYWQNALQLAGVSLLMIVYFIIVVAVNIRTASQQKVTTVYMRILTNYFQMLSLARDYDLSWEDSMKKFLEYMSFIAEASNIIISQDCFIRESTSRAHPLFLKLVIACFFPLIGIFLISIGWYIIGKCKKDVDYKSNIMVTIIIFIFLCLPPIMSLGFDAFNCKDIFNDETSYLVPDMNVQCWSGDHDIYAKAFGIPIMLIWVIGLPFLAFYFLFKNQKQLFEEHNLFKFGFLFIGLHQKAYYWEILIHYRKVAMVSINIFFMSFEPLYRALIGFIVLIIYIELLQKINPYQSEQLNRLEFLSNIAAFATFYGGLFFIDDSIPFAGQIGMMILIIAFNAYFWYYWISMMFSNIHTRFCKYLTHYVCPKWCIRKVKRTAIDDEFSEMNQSNNESSFRNKNGVVDSNSMHSKDQRYDASQPSITANNNATIQPEINVLTKDMISEKQKKVKKSDNSRSNKSAMRLNGTTQAGVTRFDIDESIDNLVQVKAKKKVKDTNKSKVQSLLPNQSFDDMEMNGQNMSFPQAKEEGTIKSRKRSFEKGSEDETENPFPYKQSTGNRVIEDSSSPMLSPKPKAQKPNKPPASPMKDQVASSSDPKSSSSDGATFKKAKVTGDKLQSTTIPSRPKPNGRNAQKTAGAALTRLESIIEGVEETKQTPQSEMIEQPVSKSKKKLQEPSATAFAAGKVSMISEISYIKDSPAGVYSVKTKKTKTNHGKRAFQEDQDEHHSPARQQYDDKISSSTLARPVGKKMPKQLMRDILSLSDTENDKS